MGCARDKGGGTQGISDRRDPVNKLIEKEICRVCRKEAEEAKEKNTLRVTMRSSWAVFPVGVISHVSFDFMAENQLKLAECKKEIYLPT